MIELSFSWAMHPRNWGIGWGRHRISTEEAEANLALPTTSYSLWLGPVGFQLTIYYLRKEGV